MIERSTLNLKKILFVEDEPEIFELIEMSLTNVGGFETHGFINGKDALGQALAIRPQLILLDVMMPGMDGTMVYNALREFEEFKDLPVVFLTAKVSSRNMKRFISLGAADVLTKPFDPMVLPDTLRAIWFNHIELKMTGSRDGAVSGTPEPH